MRSGIGEAVGGGAIAIFGTAERFLGLVQSINFLKQQWPGAYVFLVKPEVAYGLMLVGAILFLDGAMKFRRDIHQSTGVAPASTAIAGAGSPVQTVTATSGNVAGRDVIIMNPPPAVQTPAKAPLVPRSQSPSAAVLKQRGITSTACDIPYWDQRAQNWNSAELECESLMIRNDTESPDGEADHIVAHLDFESDTYQTVSVHEGWWIEDAKVTGIHSFFIGRSETKHLVIAVRSAQERECLALPKIWDKDAHRHLPGTPHALASGQWRLKVEIVGDNLRYHFYSTGTVLNNGKSEWSKPTSTRPADWPAEED